MIEQLPNPRSNFGSWPWTEETDKNLYQLSLNWPKISIVTPSFNQGEFIEETIRSVLLQNYPNLEYIIIDGGSTDESVEIIKKYEPWITSWVSEADQGQSHAINKGIEKCTGEIFNWLNSDDSFAPNALFEVATAFLNNTYLQFVSGFENHIAIDKSVSVSNGTFLMQHLEQTIERCEISQPSTFFKLKAIRRIHGVSEDLHYIMDGEMWVKLLLQFGQEAFLKLEKVLVNFRLHPNSKTISNTLVDNFLIERCSIIADLQRFIQVPPAIIDHYIKNVYGSPKVYSLNRKWVVNEEIIEKEKLRIYFIKKYVTEQFRSKDLGKAVWGVKQLIKNKAVDFFLLKSALKLLVIR